ncbi:GGDEF domain-containing protein [Bradyrhizobium lablabi]|uniref:GGDEF domain-containing protein n=1 Tax=Bradyrhizobium lablabi TaxID=722472 RepID=UPI001BA50967|nr:GGDEF domain-containing protein [Bradyrhizobium lablabi]MBR1120894.1 GGDEF domain-containing protein [Bradyrhizobium lablabi]
MSQQGPILIVSTGGRPSFAAALDETKLFPVIDAGWADAVRAVEQLRPGAVLISSFGIDKSAFAALAAQIAAREPYLPLIVIDPEARLPDNAIPFTYSGNHPERLFARLYSALRVRSLHATVMRRLDPPRRAVMSDIDPARDATVLLIGRGGAYPALSVALGERMGVVGALSIEAAAKHLNTRDIDGIVLGEGFAPRVVDAFLTVLSEDVRFRNLPVVVTTGNVQASYDLANLELIAGDPARVAASILPMVHQHAFEVHLSRMLRSIDANGLVDARTGLLTPAAFERDFATAVYQAQSGGSGLSVARFAFDPTHARAQFDGARIISRLMRQSDFGAACSDGSVIVVFAETDLRNAHMIARRLSAVMRHTRHGKRDTRAEPLVTVATLMPHDSAKSLLARLDDAAQRAAS